ncbi:heparan-alpha-glucosaminide N-acetyltransferase domain-containing protein [Lipingzhangella sp. LS1_29]|uniref:Heparan-alpha-glucosaminide N-acetyltransferase domain-containing protein n=1 Tax=Lipingzhangella rawalii TaxID=2055835 RepID=A0ABU2H6T6_9ACTN|nr:heparan-alpha-glucosaminide N-acetyltransferase domain-containing protein [Lipingzhangella rawalii]MDS1270993.1 heparan-alpha-glucosaminide N-acetyltransferase domain-containing protein [Lipingzhangella rawalii]
MSPRSTPSVEPDPDQSPQRLVGVDVARALAVFGMFTVHLGVGSLGLLGLWDVRFDVGSLGALGETDPAEVFHQLTRGRSSALFAFLAGLSLALISGRETPPLGGHLRAIRGRVLARAVPLVLLGIAVELLGTPVAIILVYYGVFFVLAVPLLGLRAPALAGIAAATALIGPQLSYLVRAVAPLDPDSSALRQFGIPGPTDLLLSGSYPAMSFMGFVIAGMAVGRLDLRATRIRTGLAGLGVGLATLGYGGSWLALYPTGLVDRLAIAELARHDAQNPTVTEPPGDAGDRAQLREWFGAEGINALHGEVPTDTPLWLLVASPHSGTTGEVLGATGTALLVLTTCLVLADRLGRLVYPLAAVGSMALSVYVGHLVAIAVIGASPWEGVPFRLEIFVFGALVLATLWRVVLGKGPLERLLAAAADQGADMEQDRSR